MPRVALKFVLVVVGAMVISACSAEHWYVSHDRRVGDPRVGPPGQGTLGGNRAAALRDVVRHLRSVRLQAGALSVYHEPHGDSRLLAASGPPESDRGPAQAHAWWILSEPAAQVLAHADAHRPAGASFAGSGSGGDYNTGRD